MDQAGPHVKMAVAKGVADPSELQPPRLSSTATLAIEFFRLTRSPDGPRFEAVAAVADRIGWDVWEAWELTTAVHEEIERVGHGSEAEH